MQVVSAMTAPSPAGLSPLLDQLDEARAATTMRLPLRQDSGYGEDVISADGVQFGVSGEPADAALIVAAVNALSDLVGALRGCLRWANQLDREALALGAMPHDLHKAEAAQKRDAAAGIRAALTAALTPGADTAGATA